MTSKRFNEIVDTIDHLVCDFAYVGFGDTVEVEVTDWGDFNEKKWAEAMDYAAEDADKYTEDDEWEIHRFDDDDNVCRHYIIKFHKD